MLKQNRFSRYLIYAIGEIILVVIGILIALQINDWNDRQKMVLWEQQFLIDLNNELENNLNQLKIVYNTQYTKQQASIAIKTLIENGERRSKEHIDSLYNLSQRFNPTFFPTTGVYDSGMASGKIEQLGSDQLKYAIMNLYNHFYKRLVYNGEVLDQVVHRVDWEKIKFYDENNQALRDYEVIQNSEFLAIIEFHLSQNKVYTRLANQNIEEIERVIKMIHKK